VSLNLSAPTPSIERIVICGGGLAGHMTAAALSHQLPSSVQITLLDCRSDADLFYGNATNAAAYEFNLSVGVSEPQLILESDTAFSWGAKYVRWGAGGRSWIQCFHLALPIEGGVLFHHHLSRLKLGELEPFLVSAMAARKGAFAHPTERGGPLLSRAEYGYQFDPRAYASLFAAAQDKGRVRVVASSVADIELGENGIAAIHCSDGQSLSGDLYVDCTGPKAVLMSRLGVGFSGQRHLRGVTSQRAAGQIGEPHRTVTASAFGWQAITPLQGSVARLTIYDPRAEAQALAAHGEAPERTADATCGRRDEAWFRNCVAIGQAASVVEPLTPAPMMLLQRDIERLLALIPISDDMSVESREFNRRHEEDYTHAELFRRALHEAPSLPEGPYLSAVREEPIHDKLAYKIEQFESRGLLVSYDLEPFNLEDWTILHCGMGRRPARYDPLADQASEASLRQHLESLRSGIEKLVNAMPSHAAYMNGLIAYLKQSKG
jgi:tryptophan 7-halogenase